MNAFVAKYMSWRQHTHALDLCSRLYKFKANWSAMWAFEMEIWVNSSNPDDQTSNLYRWLVEENIRNIEFEKKRSVVSKNDMGADLLPCIIALIEASTPAVIEVVRSIALWIEATRSKADIEIHLKEDVVIKMNLRNIDNVEHIIKELIVSLNTRKN